MDMDIPEAPVDTEGLADMEDPADTEAPAVVIAPRWAVADLPWVAECPPDPLWAAECGIVARPVGMADAVVACSL